MTCNECNPGFPDGASLCHCGHPLDDHALFTSGASCRVTGCDCPGWAEGDEEWEDDAVADLNEVARELDALSEPQAAMYVIRHVGSNAKPGQVDLDRAVISLGNTTGWNLTDAARKLQALKVGEQLEAQATPIQPPRYIVERVR